MEKDLGVVVGNKLNMNQQWLFLARKKTRSFLGCIRCSTASRWRGGDPGPLLGTGEATHEVLGPGLGSPAEERHGATRESPLKGHKEN